MIALERQLIKKARQKHLKIYPCAEKKDLSACFTKTGDRLFFWYNTHDCSTHVESGKIETMTPALSDDFAPAA